MPTKKSTKVSRSSTSSLNKISSPPGGPGSLQIKSYGFIFSTLLGIIGITINILAIFWIYKLENIDCKCSNNWMRIYIKYYLHVIIPVMVITFFMNLYLYNNINIDIKTNLLFSFFLFFSWFANIFGFINIIISIIFINKLKEINCDCSEDIKREVYYIYNIIMASLLCITILIGLMSIPIVILRLK
jgi:hypothetical protein